MPAHPPFVSLLPFSIVFPLELSPALPPTIGPLSKLSIARNLILFLRGLSCFGLNFLKNLVVVGSGVLNFLLNLLGLAFIVVLFVLIFLLGLDVKLFYFLLVFGGHIPQNRVHGFRFLNRLKIF